MITEFSSIHRSYTIAFTMRSGSNELCKLLLRNGLGVPGESFQTAPTLEQFVKFVQENQANGIFGSKMAHNHRAALDEQLRRSLPDYKVLDDVLPGHRWVWLKRRDKVLQAISLFRAEMSKVYASDQSTADRSADTCYDFFYILSRAQLIFAAELAWQAFFKTADIRPFVVVYEDLFADLDHALPKLIDYLGGLPSGRESSSADKNLTYDVLRDQHTYRLRERFVADLSRMGGNSMRTELGKPMMQWTRFLYDCEWRV